MSVMIEIFYSKPCDPIREKSIETCVSNYSGKVTYREDEVERPICLTVEFPSWETAIEAASKLRKSGEHVEGPMDYGDD